jgi:hypothetical protein
VCPSDIEGKDSLSGESSSLRLSPQQKACRKIMRKIAFVDERKGMTNQERRKISGNVENPYLGKSLRILSEGEEENRN